MLSDATDLEEYKSLESVSKESEAKHSEYEDLLLIFSLTVSAVCFIKLLVYTAHPLHILFG